MGEEASHYTAVPIGEKSKIILERRYGDKIVWLGISSDGDCIPDVNIELGPEAQDRLYKAMREIQPKGTHRWPV